MPATIRPARAADQAAIVAIVRAARINPTNLRWQRFVGAEDQGRIVGVGQIKPHRDGSRELASLAVIPERRGQGIGDMLVRALQAQSAPPLYLTCLDHLEQYYARSGFRRIPPDTMPPALRRTYRLVNGILAVVRQRTRLIVMVWEGYSCRLATTGLCRKQRSG